MFLDWLTKIFGSKNERELKKLWPVVDQINSFEPAMKALSNDELKAQTRRFKERIEKGEPLDALLPEAFATVREASVRTLNMRHFDAQLIGGMVLHQGKIAEMKTGEGKTLAATLPAYLNSLTGKGVHIITVNDYLARRDTEWMGTIYSFLGLSVGCILHGLDDPERQIAYHSDITYGTNNEFGFDYLRDNMKFYKESIVQGDLNYAIVDEVDSILIDEARTPLIISGQAEKSTSLYYEINTLIPRLSRDTDYVIDEKARSAVLTEEGVAKAERLIKVENLYDPRNIETLHHINQALKAHALFKRDVDYIVKEGEVIIVDEFTGRLMPGRRYSEGLHQALEAKENVRIENENQTLATITFQNYFRMYKKLAGMTGTASTSAEEFDKVYGLEVITVPTNKPLQRIDMPDRIYKAENGKFNAVVQEIKGKHESGQPVLVGTTSIEKNEYLGKLLDREGVPHQILNAKQHEKEGEIIAQAGKLGQVTIATNMAGRGVDIVLGGNPFDAEQAEKVKELGGLHVIGTERHEARRIDNQLRGRTARQGDNGSSQFFVSLEDDLMRIFASDKIKSLMNVLKIPEDQPIEAKMVSGAIESAQGKIEGMNFDLRKHILDYDDVMNKHREIIYKKRKDILEKADGGGLKPQILEMLKKHGQKEEDYEKKEKEFGSEKMRQVEKIVSLRILDSLWLEHLENMDHLRDSVRLRAYGQQDPLIEYKSEGHRMFQDLLKRIEAGIANTILKVTLVEQPQQPQSAQFSGSKKNPGRNDPCPCGSGKKFKKCHGK